MIKIAIKVPGWDKNEWICLATNVASAMFFCAVGYGLQHQWPGEILIMGGFFGLAFMYFSMLSGWYSGTGQYFPESWLTEKRVLTFLMSGFMYFGAAIYWMVLPVFDHPAWWIIGYPFAGCVQALGNLFAWCAGNNNPREVM